MSFRRRTILLAAGAVAAAVVMASVVVYIATRNELRGQIDASLRQKVTPGEPQSVQIVTSSGRAMSVPAGLGRSGGLIRRVSRATRPAPGSKEKSGEVLGFERRTLLPGSGLSASAALPPGAPTAFNKLILPKPTLGGPTGYVQLYLSNGTLLHSGTAKPLPVGAAARAVAAGKRNSFFRDVTIGGTRARMLTERAPEGGVWEVALPLAETEATLSRLRLLLAIVSLAGIALAAALGLLVSRAALAPVKRLTGAAERVARTQDLGHRIDVPQRDELGRLAASFNTMLAALERSRLAQRQLVSDASHELRTPIASVQANLDALALGDRLPAGERAHVISAAQAQLGELTALVGDLVDLSNSEVEEIEIEDVRLDVAVVEAVKRARLHAPACRFDVESEPCLIRASPARLARAIGNLLDNACKWSSPSPPAPPIEVRVREGVLEVRDHGPGIAPEDLPRVFDRFYRSPAARSRPGSGLGLAIVRQVAEAHGGAVHAANDPLGGARLTLELPTQPVGAAELLGGVEVEAGGDTLHEAPPVL